LESSSRLTVWSLEFGEEEEFTTKRIAGTQKERRVGEQNTRSCGPFAEQNGGSRLQIESVEIIKAATRTGAEPPRPEEKGSGPEAAVRLPHSK
jgi:hypothetical protein